jgi:hypothetical protein
MADPDHRPDAENETGVWFPTAPPPVEAVPAARAIDVRGQRLVVGKAGHGWRYDLRGDDPVTGEDGKTYIPVLAEHDWYRAETDQVEVFAPLVPIEHVWVEQIASDPATAPQPDGPQHMLNRLVTLDAPPVRHAIAARDVPGLTGRRLVLVVRDERTRGLRALTEPYQRDDGAICARICKEPDWYRWGAAGIPAPSLETPIYMLWVEP